MADELKPTPDGFDAMEDSLTRSRSIIESLRAEIAKYRGMEVELAAVKNDREMMAEIWPIIRDEAIGDGALSDPQISMAVEAMNRILGGK
jgi:hypothetical protein